jgi:hypothetical protein
MRCDVTHLSPLCLLSHRLINIIRPLTKDETHCTSIASHTDLSTPTSSSALTLNPTVTINYPLLSLPDFQLRLERRNNPWKNCKLSYLSAALDFLRRASKYGCAHITTSPKGIERTVVSSAFTVPTGYYSRRKQIGGSRTRHVLRSRFFKLCELLDIKPSENKKMKLESVRG